MDCEDLSRLAEKTKQELDTVWNAIGLTPAERQAQLDNLIAEVRAVYNNRVHKEQATQAQMEQDIANMHDQILLIRKQLEIIGEYSAAQVSRWTHSYRKLSHMKSIRFDQMHQGLTRSIPFSFAWWM